MVGGLKGVGVQVHAGVDHPRLFLHEPGDAPVMRGAHDKRTDLVEITENGTGQGRTFLRIGAGAQFIHQHQRVNRGPGHDVLQICDVGAEGGQRLLDALLIADVRVDSVEPGEMGFIGRHVQPGLGHHGQQAHRFQSNGLASGVGAGDQHHPLAPVQIDADRHHVSGEQGVAGANEFQIAVRHFLVSHPRGHRPRRR